MSSELDYCCSNGYRHVLTFQSKRLFKHFSFNDLYMCIHTRESSHKYDRMRSSNNLFKNFYPIWLFRPSEIEYTNKGKLFNHPQIISAVDMENFILTEMFFHISLNSISYKSILELSNHYYLYEFVLSDKDIFNDTIEGYGICGVTTHLWRQDLVGVYEISIADSKHDFMSTLSVTLNPLYSDITSLSTESIRVPTNFFWGEDKIIHNPKAQLMHDRQLSNLFKHLPLCRVVDDKDISMIDFSLFNSDSTIMKF